ncbi:MAG: hypothetical protein ACJ74Y_14975 [Bryobacteraceae bacterium]
MGFVYRVLQGHGAFHCFAFFHTWNEALEEALRRAADPQLDFVEPWGCGHYGLSRNT